MFKHVWNGKIAFKVEKVIKVLDFMRATSAELCQNSFREVENCRNLNIFPRLQPLKAVYCHTYVPKTVKVDWSFEWKFVGLKNGVMLPFSERGKSDNLQEV